MKRFLRSIGIIFIILVVLVVFYLMMPRVEGPAVNGTNNTLQEGDMAPDFSASLADGSTFTLSDHSDECVLINFWATWCGPCVGEMPAFQKLSDEGIKGLKIICIDCQEDKKTVDSFIKENGYTFNIAYDTKGDICAKYPTRGIPYTLVVNKGKIVNIYLGADDADTQYKEYKGAIDACLGE